MTALTRPATPFRALALALLASAVLAVSARGATPTARYAVVFESRWSAANHPVDFPPGAHFSPLIGTTHDDTVRFFVEGAVASEGIERMAEAGRSSPFDEEVEAAVQAGGAREFLERPGFRSPGSVSLTFMVEESKPLVTLVSMLAPSPDWFVGVSALPLLENGEWVVEREVTLWAWDAGTDSGATFAADNDDTQPPEPIRRIDSGPLANGVPIGTFTFSRLDPEEPLPLTLLDGRFEIEVEWMTPRGTEGFGHGQRMTRNTGAFWFFHPDNIELIVKVLDACETRGRYWVFAGGLTNVEVMIRVRDTENGEVQVYHNPLGTPFQPLQDTGSFATCPP